MQKRSIKKINNFFVFLSIKRMNEQTLKFNNIRVNKKEFHEFKEVIDLSLVTVDQIVVSDKFEHSDDSFKLFYWLSRR